MEDDFEEKKEAMAEMEYSNQKENGVHRDGQWCKCSDCLRGKEQQDKLLTNRPF